MPGPHERETESFVCQVAVAVLPLNVAYSVLGRWLFGAVTCTVSIVIVIIMVIIVIVIFFIMVSINPPQFVRTGLRL